MTKMYLLCKIKGSFIHSRFFFFFWKVCLSIFAFCTSLFESVCIFYINSVFLCPQS